MKILLFGKNGQVGWELNRSLLPSGEIIAFGREDADFSNLENLRNIVREVKPDVIVNAVAYTGVDKAEEEEELAAIINSVAPGVLADEASNLNALLVHFSTDYVFDGTKNSPYIETDRPNPINAYGRTKLAGEVAIQSSGCDYLIFRTSWVYALRGNNFLLTILKLAKESSELSIIANQIGSPTSARLIADTTAHCIYHAMNQKRTGDFSSGLYHLTSSGYTSWYGFTKEIICTVNKRMDLKLNDENIKKISSADYPTQAKRPMNSRLALDKLENEFAVEMPDWVSSLSLYLDEME